MRQSFHKSVLVNEVMMALRVKPAGVYVDATVGDGGHTLALLRQLDPNRGFVYGMDQDPMALAVAGQRLKHAGFNNFRLLRTNFANMRDCLTRFGVRAVDGVLFDLGLSQRQLDDKQRGFSYHHDGQLDMRMDPSSSLTAAELLAQSSEQQLVEILLNYGELRYARRLARLIVRTRSMQQLTTTQQLVSLVKHVVPSRCLRAGHPARRLFQALRIAVNRELATLKVGLLAAAQLLRVSGRLVVISFHSLEDRIVKRYFRSLAGQHPGEELLTRDLPINPVFSSTQFRVITKRPIRPDHDQVLVNRRARSAKLRAVERF